MTALQIAGYGIKTMIALIIVRMLVAVFYNLYI